MGTPVTSTTFSQLDNELYLICPAGCDGAAGGFYSLKSYTEGSNGTYASYITSNNMANGTGYLVWFGDIAQAIGAVSDITISVTGSPKTGTIDLAPTFNSSDGWNLIANPYPSSISWTSLEANCSDASKIDNTYYVWNEDLGSGAYTSCHTDGTASVAEASGGVTVNLPPFRGFFVHVTATSLTLNALESHKVSTNASYWKTNTSERKKFRLILNAPMHNNYKSYSDGTVVSFLFSRLVLQWRAGT